MSNSEIVLYYANWCGHCQHFKPTWEALKPVFDKHGVKYSEYEESQNGDMIDKAGIQGFPTIRIKKDGNEYEYRGSRTADDIINEVIPDMQLGGSGSIRYKINYTQ